jgi:hypothetical protein
LIVGVIKNYKWEVVAPFFTTFKKVGFDNCDCVIFVENITQETINKIKNFDVRVIKIKGIIEANIINYRYKLYEDFLKNNPDKYNLVLAIDIRDSIFQKDIFKYYENNKSFLVLAIEDDYLNHPINKMWIIEAFGNNIYKIIENERIVCSGTILGSANKFLEFSSMIWKIANTNNYSRHNWNDQAIVNYLVYYKLFLNDCIIKNHNKDGLILTLATATPKSFFIDYESNILNGKGEIASVIHQYNRHQKIALRVIYKFCPGYLYSVVIRDNPLHPGKSPAGLDNSGCAYNFFSLDRSHIIHVPLHGRAAVSRGGRGNPADCVRQGEEYASMHRVERIQMLLFQTNPARAVTIGQLQDFHSHFF